MALRAGPARWTLGALTLGALVASVAWPLATYSMTLACFGVAHVLSELRYVDRRFGRRLGRDLRGALLVGLAAIAGTRLAGLTGWASITTATTAELIAGVALVAFTLPTLARSGRGPLAVALATAATLAIAIVTSPALGLLVLAVAHNFTPVGFLWEAEPGPLRRRAMAWAGFAFIGAPVVVLTGLAWAPLDALGIAAPEATPLGYGPLVDAMRSYVPGVVTDPAWALRWFSACVLLQCMHYVATLSILPRLPGQAYATFRWPSGRTFAILIVGSMAAVIPFAIDFGLSRRGYGVIASVHAWVEVPLLLLSYAGLRRGAGDPPTGGGPVSGDPRPPPLTDAD